MLAAIYRNHPPRDPVSGVTDKNAARLLKLAISTR
jgi:hypothetical protein